VNIIEDLLNNEEMKAKIQSTVKKLNEAFTNFAETETVPLSRMLNYRKTAADKLKKSVMF
jgi:adenylosuccinate synthase